MIIAALDVDVLDENNLGNHEVVTCIYRIVDGFVVGLVRIHRAGRLTEIGHEM